MAAPPDQQTPGTRVRLVAISGPLRVEVFPLTADHALRDRDRIAVGGSVFLFVANPNYLHRLIRTLGMKSILEPDR